MQCMTTNITVNVVAVKCRENLSPGQLIL